MSRTERLLEILITLQTKSRFTVGDLAGEFGVSRRTMLRDLHALSEMGVPLAATPGPGGGYSLIRDRRLLPLSLSPDEAIGMVLSYEAFLQYAPSPFAAQSLSAVTKLRHALPGDVIRELDRVHQHVVVTEPVRSRPAPCLPDVLQAALDGVHLDIVYDSRSGVAERRIYPYGLYAAGGLWYCACHDYRRGEKISLRMDRFRSVQRAEGPERPPAVSVRDWLRATRGDPVPLLRLRARVTPSGAKNLELETLFGEIPLNERGEGTIDASIPESEVDYYASRLLTLGADLVVESPPALIQAIRRKAREIAALYP
ncbi:MAG: WYL domain-containing protein [Chloroflexi bacterium]|nr:WYL domain-containing protein [Chloroflexota bacterium]